MRRQSTRRMAVAQKRQEDFKDVLRRPKRLSKQQKWFWRWFCNADNKIFLYSYDPTRHFQDIGMLGILPDYRPLIVRVAWLDKPCNHWVAVPVESDLIYTTDKKLSTSIARLRRLLQYWRH